MANQKQPDPARISVLAQKLVKILANEDSETRRRAVHAAMTMLGEAPISAKAHLGPSEENGKINDDVEPAAFFNRDGKLKPSDNLYLCAAYHFSLYGSSAFSLDELRDIAKEAGVVIPGRLDMTLKNAGKRGKRLFQTAGRDAYKPTVAAAVLFKEKWEVIPGKKQKSAKGLD